MSVNAGLTPDGRIEIWDGATDPLIDEVPWEAPSPFVLLADPSVASWIVALDAANLAHYAQIYYRPETWWFHPFPTTMNIIDIEPGGPNALCVLTAEGEVECVGSPTDVSVPAVFPNPPYVDLDGAHNAVCAQRADSVIECNDGTVHDFGRPVKDFEIMSSGSGYEDDTPSPAFVCALTVDDTIHCVGDYYPPDLQAQLPGAGSR